MRSALLLLVLAGLTGVATTPSRTKRPDRMLHPAVRNVIDTKMDAHAQEMTELVMLVVLLEREDAADAAERMALEPHIGRALALSDANAGIPEEFFVLQEQLSTRANALARAARDSDDARMARAFGEMTATCVACHVRYLDEPEPE